jgi:hypothetical protein
MTDTDIELKIKSLEYLIQDKQKFLEDHRGTLNARQQRDILNVIYKAQEQVERLRELQDV